MPTVTLVYGSVQSMTVTNLHSLASSPTAGWQSAVVDNTSTLHLDAHLQVVLDFANTAPSSSRAAFVYAYSGLDTTYTDPASGSEGTITLPDITANPNKLRLVGTIPYNVQDEVAESSVFSVAEAFGGVLPAKWGIIIMNHSGAALAGSGNSVTWRGIHLAN